MEKQDRKRGIRILWKTCPCTVFKRHSGRLIIGTYDMDEEMKEAKSGPNNYLVKRVPGSGSILSKAQTGVC